MLPNRLLISAKFRVLHCANVINTPPPHPKMPKSCFQRKEMLMAKRRKVLTFHSWLNLAIGEDVFLGHSSLFESVIPLSKLWSLEWVHEPTGKWARQNGRGESAQISRLPRGFPEASRPFIYCMATAKEMAMCNDINCAWAWTQVYLQNATFEILLTWVIY